MAPSNPSADMDNFRELLGSSKNIIALAGAGLSAASGIPTFRGAGGIWRQYEAMSLATPQGFRKSPSLVWQFYHYRRERALRAKPNNAHRALSAFSLPAIRQQIAPDSTFTLITQNVDGLSPRSNEEVARMFPEEANTAEDKFQLIEMHGKFFDVVCRSKYCKHTELNTNSPICEALAGTELLVEGGILDPEIPLKDLPRCSKCGSLTRPGVVWFGEQPLHTQRIDKLVAQADLCLVIGTSSNVYPAAGYATKVQDHGGKVAVFNLEVTEADEEPDFMFLGPCEETLVETLGLSIPENGKISVKAAS